MAGNLVCVRMQLFDGEEGWVAYERRFWLPSRQCSSDSPFYCAPRCSFASASPRCLP